MYNPDASLLTLEDIKSARLIIDASPHCVRTPLLQHVQTMFDLDPSIDLHLKLENMQTTGEHSTKITQRYECVSVTSQPFQILFLLIVL